MRLKQHLFLVEHVLASRHDATVEMLEIRELEPDQSANIRCRMRFWDGSILVFNEALAIRGLVLAKIRYSFHYQSAGGQLIFRYDNVPHHPQIPTFPHHKHVSEPGTNTERIMAAHPPDIQGILREIDRFLYPEVNR